VETLVMPIATKLAERESISLNEAIKRVFSRILHWFAKQKEVFLAAGIMSLTLDIVTGLIFGITGAAIFAAL
jgi:hypothetical protein